MSAKGSRTAKPLTLKKIQDRCDEIGSCWIWAQCSNRNRPQVGEQGKTVGVRRRSYELQNKVELESSMAVVDTCGEILCCAPWHLVAIPKMDVSTHSAKMGRAKNSPSGAASKALAKRKASALDDAKVAAIRARAQAGETFTAIAPDFGISAGHAGRIASGKQWRQTAAAASIFCQGAA